MVKACFNVREGQSGCDVLHDVIQVDIDLARKNKKWWVKEVCSALKHLGVAAEWLIM